MIKFTYDLGGALLHVEAEIDPGYDGNLTGSHDVAEQPQEPSVVEMEVRDSSLVLMDIEGIYVQFGFGIRPLQVVLDCIAIKQWRTNGDSE